MPSELMLTVAQVLELVPPEEGTEDVTWVNPGFQAVVGEIKTTKTRDGGKPMHICTLHDTTNEGITISMTVFSPNPGFYPGDTIQVCGKGLRRTVYKGLEQVSMGRETEIQLLKRGAEGKKAAAPAAAKPASAPAGARPASSESTPAASPALGVTVGMALNNAGADLRHNAHFDGDAGHVIDFSKHQHDLEQVALLYLQASRRLETGQVTMLEDVPI